MVLPNSGISLSRSITYARTPGAATPMEMGLRIAGQSEFAGNDAAANYARADVLAFVKANQIEVTDSADKQAEGGMAAEHHLHHHD